MTSTLHNDVAVIARERPAMVISQRVLEQMVLDCVKRAGKFGSLALPIPTGHAAVDARVSSLSIDPDAFTAQLVAGLADPADPAPSPRVVIGPNFILSIDLSEPVSKLKFATVEISVSGATAVLRGRDDRLTFDWPSISVAATVQPSADRAAAIAAAGSAVPITADDLLRVEGALAFGSAEQLVRKAIGIIRPLDLAAMFPAFRFSGALDLHVVGGALVVIPERFELLGLTGCPTGDITAGVYAKAKTSTAESDTTRNWPITIDAASPRSRFIDRADGMVAAYLPMTLLSLHFGASKPGLNYHESDNGFVGWDLKLNTSIVDIEVTVDPVAMGVRIALRIELSGLLLVTVDVPCLGRVELAQAHVALPKAGQAATIKVLVRPAVDFSGKLMLLSEIEHGDLGQAEVSIQLVAKYLGYVSGGGGGLTGLIFDSILGRIMSHNVPRMVLETVREKLDRSYFVLADLSDLIPVLRDIPTAASWSDDTRSALIGITKGG